jgi:hypothetical protein
MALDLATAEQRALEAIAGGVLGEVEVVPVDSLPGIAYNFDPSGWLLFAVHRPNEYRVGGDEYLGVHSETGEVRALGIIGE